MNQFTNCPEKLWTYRSSCGRRGNHRRRSGSSEGGSCGGHSGRRECGSCSFSFQSSLFLSPVNPNYQHIIVNRHNHKQKMQNKKEKKWACWECELERERESHHCRSWIRREALGFGWNKASTEAETESGAAVCALPIILLLGFLIWVLWYSLVKIV